MALITRYINPSSSAGGDGTTNNITGATRAYASFAEWEAAEQADLVSAGNSHEVLCDDGQDTSTARILGWTTGSSNTITVKGSGGGIHNGTHRDVSGAGYEIKASANQTLLLQEDFVTVQDICLTNIGSGLTALQISTISASNQLTFDRLIVAHTGGGSGRILSCSAANAVATIRNSIFYGNVRGADTRTSSGFTWEYCTCYTTGDFCFVTSASDVFTNCAAGGSSSADYWSGGTSTGDHNASEDTSATTQFTSSQASMTLAVEFVNVSTGASADFHLKSGGTALQGNGANISGVTIDIDGDSRHATTPDIGADEFTASQSATVTGTAISSITESDIVAGGKTIILTLTGDTFVTGTASEDGIAAGLGSDKIGANKWDAVVKPVLDNTHVVISTTTVANDTATIILPSIPAYNTDEQEVITITIPAASLVTSITDITASPAFTVDTVVGPVLTFPNASAITDTTADLNVSTNTEGGWLYMYTGTSATAPSVVDLKAGTGATKFGSIPA